MVAQPGEIEVSPLVLTSFTAVNALGQGKAAIYAALRDGRTGLTRCDFEDAKVKTFCGRVAGLEEAPIDGALSEFDGRNNRLAEIGLAQDNFGDAVAWARKRYGAARIAVIIGTSTSGILETEHAYRRRDPANGDLPGDYRFRYSHNLYATTHYVRRRLGLEGPAATISTACSSSAKVFANAWRWMQLGLCDAAVVGGVDSLCLNTLYGFNALELVSPERCRPCDANRRGISIGEAAGFALLEDPARASGHSGIAFLGYGESSDAYHMSTPHPEGLGAALAMRGALKTSGLAPEQIDYVNMHGTASQVNDAMEDKAITQVLGARVPASSTKGWTGHALGAAGITEAVISALCIQNGLLPGNLNTITLDPAMTSDMLLENRRAKVNRVMSNSFGFGGSNASLILGRHA